MLGKYKKLLTKIPEQDLKEFYCAIYGNCDTDDRVSYEQHLISYLRMYLHERRASYVTNEEVILSMTVKAMKILAWMEYLQTIYK